MKTRRPGNRKGVGASRRETLAKAMHDPWAGIGRPNRSGGRSGSAKGLFGALAIATVVAGAGLFHVWTRSEHLRLAYAIVASEARVQAAEAERSELKVEVARLSSPMRIARLAGERLELRAPEPGQVVDLPPSNRQAGQALARASLRRQARSDTP